MNLAPQSIRSAELFRLQGLGRMIRIEHAGGTLFLTVVVRFCIAGQFATINFFKTGKLLKLLDSELQQKGDSNASPCPRPPATETGVRHDLPPSGGING